MTDIEAKALALLNDVAKDRDVILNVYFDREITTHEALCRAIEAHEAFKQEVSDAVEEYKADQPYVWKQSASNYFDRFIIPKPKPDPLIEVLRSVGGDDRDYCDYDIYVKEIRAALEARGLEIREKGQ